MKRHSLLYVILLTVSVTAFGQDIVAPPDPVAPEIQRRETVFNDQCQEPIEEALRQRIEQESIPGLSVAMAVNDELVYAKGFGFADLENGVATTIKTKFRTASIAKSLTAVAVMSLVEDGKIDLDAVVQTYCPEYPKKRWPLTTRHLLGHLGGVRHYVDGDESYATKHFFSLTAALDPFRDDPLLHEPGTKYRYTTFGFNLLGSVAEGASGKTFMELLDEHVLQPSGMQDTVQDDQYALIPHRTRGYKRFSESQVQKMEAKGILQPGEIYNASFHDTSMKVPGGGLLSTPSDLIRFAIALNQDKLLSPSTRETMWTIQQPSNGKSSSYAMGWRIKTLDDQRLIYHTGSQPGTRTAMLLDPDSGVAVAIMSNLRCDSLYELAVTLASMASVPPVLDRSGNR